MPLVPFPQKLATETGQLDYRKELNLVFDQENKEEAAIAKTFSCDAREKGFKVALDSGEKAIKIIDKIKPKENSHKESYKLSLKGEINLTLKNITSLFWGTRTLLKLLDILVDKRKLSHLVIRDFPEFEHRGLMIDNARRFHSLKFYLKTIRTLSSYKLNHYHIHFSDFESYTLPSSVYPKLPTPRIQIVAERVWTGSKTSPKSLLESALVPIIGHLKSSMGNKDKCCNLVKSIYALIHEIMQVRLRAKIWHTIKWTECHSGPYQFI